jgi:hypothetical protein
MIVLLTLSSNALLLLKVLEGRLREEAELARRLGLRYRDSDAALRDVTEERSVYITMLEDARATINQQQDELKDTRYTYIYIYIYRYICRCIHICIHEEIKARW